MTSKLPGLVGQSVHVALATLALPADALSYSDEPPGKLRMLGAPMEGGEIELHLQYEPSILFSERRTWPLDRIGAAKVIGIVWHDAAGRHVFGTIDAGMTRP
jgi:hypothetical protein